MAPSVLPTGGPMRRSVSVEAGRGKDPTPFISVVPISEAMRARGAADFVVSGAERVLSDVSSCFSSKGCWDPDDTERDQG